MEHHRGHDQTDLQLDARRNEYKLTKSMVENLEGFPESIKFLSKSKDWIKDAPLLSDLIYCKEDAKHKYEFSDLGMLKLPKTKRYNLMRSLDSCESSSQLIYFTLSRLRLGRWGRARFAGVRFLILV